MTSVGLDEKYLIKLFFYLRTTLKFEMYICLSATLGKNWIFSADTQDNLTFFMKIFLPMCL